MQDPKSHHLGTIAQIRRAISSQWRHVSTIGKKLVKQQYLPHMSSQYGGLQHTSGWNRFVSLGHPSKFQPVSRLGSVTARHSSSRHQPNFSALNRGRHLCSAGRPSRWALAHILVVRYRTIVLSDCNVDVLWPNSWIDQDATCKEVGLSPGDIVLDGDPVYPHGKGHSRHSNFQPTLLWYGRPSQQLLSSCLQCNICTSAVMGRALES